MPTKPRRHIVYDKKKSDRSWILPTLVLVFLAVVLFWPLGEEPTPGVRLDAPPEAVVGYWSTEDSRYDDRFIRITTTGVELGLGSEGGAVYGRITTVTRRTEDGFEVVRLEYSLPGGEDVLEITLHGVNRMRLRNPPEVVWVRY